MRKTQILIIALTILLTTAFLLILVLPKNKQPGAVPQGGQTTIVGSPAPTQAPQAKVTKEQLIALMPVSTEKFTIQYISVEDYFLVNIDQSPYDASKTEAEKWFKDKYGDDLSNLEIVYLASRYVQ